MKKLINKREDAVTESLAGMAAAHRDLIKVFFQPHYVTRANSPVRGKVAMLSGGGSGHEPLHAGYVGRGMLDAACPGNIFTPPTADQIFAATKAIHGGSGVLHIVKNYSADVMNFEMAAEMCKEQDIKVTSVLINDDVAVENSLYTRDFRSLRY